MPTSPFLERKAREFSLLSLRRRTDEYRDAVISPIMYNYIKDRSLYRRNVAIVLGNSGDPDAVPALIDSMDDPAEVVRAHAAWPLGRMGVAPPVVRSKGDAAEKSVKEPDGKLKMPWKR